MAFGGQNCKFGYVHHLGTLMFWLHHCTVHELIHVCINYLDIKRCLTPRVNNLLTLMSSHASGLAFEDQGVQSLFFMSPFQFYNHNERKIQLSRLPRADDVCRKHHSPNY